MGTRGNNLAKNMIPPFIISEFEIGMERELVREERVFSRMYSSGCVTVEQPE